MLSSILNMIKDSISAVFDWAFSSSGLFASVGILGFVIFFVVVYIFFSRVLGLQVLGVASDKVKQGVYNLTHKDSKVTIRRS